MPYNRCCQLPKGQHTGHYLENIKRLVHKSYFQFTTWKQIFHSNTFITAGNTSVRVQRKSWGPWGKSCDRVGRSDRDTRFFDVSSAHILELAHHHNRYNKNIFKKQNRASLKVWMQPYRNFVTLNVNVWKPQPRHVFWVKKNKKIF